MNQEEEVPARVTRGALRRRSIDQDATPQNALATTGTTIAGGTPKKATSTKKAPALGAIQENGGHQSTPIAGSRISRRRTSETVDTPTTTAPNKSVLQLKESESILGSGRRSRNTSLTEENLKELNAANESDSSSLRVRTPARLRGSQETLTSTTPATATAALRRSTRRNSVTSDDGSVQSLSLTTPKLAVSRRLKDEIIVEEEASDGRADSVASEPSPRSTPRRQLGSAKVASQSPRGETRSPVVSFRVEQTPPRGSVSPKVGGSSSLKLPNSTPRSKNVSFADDSKLEDNHSSYPKTPTSPGKKFVLVGVNDLRNTPLINGAPKANAEIDLNAGDSDMKMSAQKTSLSRQETPPDSNASADLKVVVPASPKPSLKTATKSADESIINDASDILLVSEGSMIGTLNSNDESGIEALECSIVEQAHATSYTTLGEGEKFSTCWNHSVRGSASKGIDAFSVRKQEEEEKTVDIKEQLNASQKSFMSAEKKKNEKQDKEKEENDQSEREEEEEQESEKNEFADDEAMEVDGYQSGDSMGDETREEMMKNEIPDQGEDLGSEDTEDDDLDGEFENDSFIVSDGDEDALLNDSGDDLSLASPEKSQQAEKKPKRRRILSVANDDDTDEEDEKKREQGKETTSPKSPRLLPSNPSPSTRSPDEASAKRSAAENLMTDDESSPEQKSTNRSVTTAVAEQCQPAGTPSKTNNKDPAPLVADDGQERKSTSVQGDRQSLANKSLDVTACGSPASTETFSMDENETPDGSGTLFEASQQEVLVKKEQEEEQEEKQGEKDGKSMARVSSSASRKSLPAGLTKGSLAEHDKGAGAGGRKSLPSNARMHFVEEVTTAEEVQLSASNLQSSYQEDENQHEEEEQPTEKSQKEQQTTSTAEKRKDADDKKNTSTSDEEEYVQATDSGEQESHEALAPAVNKEPPGKPSRKSLPVSSLISAQFYLAGSKKEKRNTIAVVEAGLMTSTPKGKQSSAKETRKENDPPTGEESSTLVANPFALANASKTTKARARLSMDSAVTVEQSGKKERTSKKVRNSLPAKLDEQTEEVGTDEPQPQPQQQQQQQQQQQHETEPEPMEVDEYVEEEEPQQNGVVEQEQRKAKAPVPKKVKALEDFNLENILSRCNEVVRADKERKKQLATLAQQKRDEKRRLRQLREQQQSEEGSDGNEPEVQQRDMEEDNGGQEGAASSQQQNNSSGESLEKKKKKRKKKLKNYVLEELAEMKKDRVAEAMLRKLQQQEERKQRKQERRAAKLNALLNKENGETTGATHGIGAKLEQVAKKKRRRQLEKEQAQQSKAAEEDASKPVVRVALSAFAVFQELQNGQPKSVLQVQQQQQQQQQKNKNAPVMQKTHGKLEELVKEVPKDPKKKIASVEEPNTVPEQREEQQGKHEKRDKKQAKKDRPVEVTAESKAGAVDAVVVEKKPTQVDTDVAIGGGLMKKKKNAGTDNKPNEPAAVVNVTSEKIVEKVVSPAGGGTSKGSMVADASSKRKEANKENLTIAQEAPVELPGKEKPKGKHHQSQPKLAPEPTVSEEKKKKNKQKQKKVQEEPSVPADNKKGKREKGGSQATAPKDTLVSDALREIRETLYAERKQQQSKQKAANHEKPPLPQDGVVAKLAKERKKATEEQKRAVVAAVEASPSHPPPAVAPINGSKKRKRDLLDGSSVASSTPARPKKQRALQRADCGFIEETVTPEKTRLKRNFGFQELQATPKAVGFKVSSVLPEDLRPFAGEPSKKKKKNKTAATDKRQAAATNDPQPVWTSTGYFLEIPEQPPAAPAPDGTKLQSKQATKATVAGARKGKGTASGGSGSYIDLEGHEGFRLKTLGGGGQSIGTGGKPHRYDPDTVSQVQLSFKRQQLLEKTANLREKKMKGGGYV